MAITATPSAVTVYPAGASNPNGNPTATVTLSGDTSYSVNNPHPSVATASITGSTMTVTYVGPGTAGTPFTFTVTGSPSGLTTTVTVTAYGALALAGFSPAGSSNGTFTVVEPGYPGTFTATIDPPLASLSLTSGTGPTWTTGTVSPQTPGECVVTITDDHGGGIQFLVTVFAGLPSVSRPSPLGYPTAGVWFDFLHLDEDQLPCVGEIRGMPVTGAEALRGPQDYGNFVWCSGLADQLGQFEVGYGDFGNPIQVTFAGRSDFFDNEFGDNAYGMIKTVISLLILVSVPSVAQGEQLTFTSITTADLYSALQAFGANAISALGTESGAVVGTAVVGQARLGASDAAQAFGVSRSYAQSNASGHVLQIGYQETSVYPWTCLGYQITASATQETQ